MFDSRLDFASRLGAERTPDLIAGRKTQRSRRRIFRNVFQVVLKQCRYNDGITETESELGIFLI